MEIIQKIKDNAGNKKLGDDNTTDEKVDINMNELECNETNEEINKKKVFNQDRKTKIFKITKISKVLVGSNEKQVVNECFIEENTDHHTQKDQVISINKALQEEVHTSRNNFNNMLDNRQNVDNYTLINNYNILYNPPQILPFDIYGTQSLLSSLSTIQFSQQAVLSEIDCNIFNNILLIYINQLLALGASLK